MDTPGCKGCCLYGICGGGGGNGGGAKGFIDRDGDNPIFACARGGKLGILCAVWSLLALAA